MGYTVWVLKKIKYQANVFGLKHEKTRVVFFPTNAFCNLTKAIQLLTYSQYFPALKTDWVHVVCVFLVVFLSVFSGFTCVLWGTDAVAVTLFVHRSSGAGCGESPVSGQGVWGAGGMRPVQSPLAGVAAPCCSRSSFGSASGSGV